MIDNPYSFFDIKGSLDEVEKIATSTSANSFLNNLNSIAVRPRDFAKSLVLLSVLFAILILE